MEYVRERKMKQKKQKKKKKEKEKKKKKILYKTIEREITKRCKSKQNER